MAATCNYLGSTLHPVTVTARIITFRVEEQIQELPLDPTSQSPQGLRGTSSFFLIWHWKAFQNPLKAMELHQGCPFHWKTLVCCTSFHYACNHLEENMKTCGKKSGKTRNMQQTCSFCLISMTTASTISWRILVVDLGNSNSRSSRAILLLHCHYPASRAILSFHVPKCSKMLPDFLWTFHAALHRNG